VAAHEIPQEVGDVAILLASGYSRGRALLLNLVTGVASIAGALIAFGAVRVIPSIRPYVLAMSAASLLYIAMSDLIPNLHKGELDANAFRQVVLIAAGIGTIVFFERMIG
jgi:zinc and cadmium transporter